MPQNLDEHSEAHQKKPEEVYEQAMTDAEWMRYYMTASETWFRNYHESAERWIKHSNRILISVIALVVLTITVSLVKLIFFPDVPIIVPSAGQ